jgi:small subunit ribosomal protein S20
VANIKSAKKRIKVINKKNAINKANRTVLKNALKKFDAAVEAGNKEEATKLFSATESVIRKSVTRGIVHKNAAGRKVARLAKKLKAMA